MKAQDLKTHKQSLEAAWEEWGRGDEIPAALDRTSEYVNESGTLVVTSYVTKQYQGADFSAVAPGTEGDDGNALTYGDAVGYTEELVGWDEEGEPILKTEIVSFLPKGSSWATEVELRDKRTLPTKRFERTNLDLLPDLFAEIERARDELRSDADWLADKQPEHDELLRRADTFFAVVDAQSFLRFSFYAHIYAQLGRVDIKNGKGSRAETANVRTFVVSHSDWPLSMLSFATGRSKATIAEIVAAERQRVSEASLCAPRGLDADKGRSDDPAPASPSFGELKAASRKAGGTWPGGRSAIHYDIHVRGFADPRSRFRPGEELLEAPPRPTSRSPRPPRRRTQRAIPVPVPDLDYLASPA